MTRVAVGGLEWQNSSGTVEVFSSEGLGLELCKLGLELTETSEQADFYLALNHFDKHLRRVKNQIPPSRRILIVWEPHIVIPENFHGRTYKKYGFVNTFNRSISDRVPGSYVSKWPQQDNVFDSFEVPPFRDREAGSVALINTNKVSPLEGNYYGLRRKIALDLSAKSLKLEIAGSGWDYGWFDCAKQNLLTSIWAIYHGELPRFSEFIRETKFGNSVRLYGKVQDKILFLQANRFALVIENTADYVSEKLFDAIAAGCVPLYCGPPLEEFGIPGNVAIQLGENVEQYAHVVSTLELSAAENLIKSGKNWLASKKTKSQWSAEPIFKKMASVIAHQIHSVTD